MAAAHTDRSGGGARPRHPPGEPEGSTKMPLIKGRTCLQNILELRSPDFSRSIDFISLKFKQFCTLFILCILN